MDKLINGQISNESPIVRGILIALTPFRSFVEPVDLIISDDEMTCWLYVHAIYDGLSAAYAVIFACMGIAIPTSFLFIEDETNVRLNQSLECTLSITAKSSIFRGLVITNSKKPSASAKRS